MRQLHERKHVPAFVRNRPVDRGSIPSRLLTCKVCATAEAASATDTRIETRDAPTERAVAPATKRVYFEVFREVAVGEDVRVVGDHQELGAWDASQGLALQWHPGNVWRGSVQLPAATEFMWKLVKAGADGVCVEWEEGDDRILNLQELPRNGVSASVLWGHPAEYSSCVPYTKEEPIASADMHNAGDAPAVQDSPAEGSYTARIAIQKELCLGQHLKLAGSDPVLAEWDFRAAPAFTWSPEHVWQLELQLPLGTPVDWKIVQAVEGNDDWCEWQSGENTIVDPSALQLSSGDILEVGCTWEGTSRATIVETASSAAARNGAAQPEMIEVTEEPVYGSDGVLSDSDSSTDAIASIAHAVSTRPVPEATIVQAVNDGTAVFEKPAEVQDTREFKSFDEPPPAPTEQALEPTAVPVAEPPTEEPPTTTQPQPTASAPAPAQQVQPPVVRDTPVAAAGTAPVPPPGVMPPQAQQQVIEPATQAAQPVGETAAPVDAMKAPAPPAAPIDASIPTPAPAAPVDASIPAAPAAPVDASIPAPTPPAASATAAGTPEATAPGTTAPAVDTNTAPPAADPAAATSVPTPAVNGVVAPPSPEATNGSTAAAPPASTNTSPAPPASLASASAAAPVDSPAPAPTASADSPPPAAAAAAPTESDAASGKDILKELQASGAGLEDIVLSPEQLSKLAEAGLPDGTSVTIAEQDDVTFELQKGRLEKDGEGSTIVVRGGMDYDSDTGTVTVNSPLGSGPDGLLVDTNGKSLEAPKETSSISGSTQQPAVKLISPENIADVKPEDEVGVLTKVGAYAGMAAAGLGAATLMGGLAVDLADVAVIAGLYGVATAIGTSQNEAVRAKGAAGPVLSALVTASDIARRMKGTCTDAQKGKGPVKPTIGKYEKSQTADVSKRGSMPIPTDEEIAAMQAEHAIARKAELRAVEMQAQLGENGMQALEEGVNQVMSTDVQRILKALDSSLKDEDKVIHLVKMLINGQPAACKTEESLKVEVRAAMILAEEHVEVDLDTDKKTQHAPAVLLAALAMSAVDEMRGVKTI